MKSLQQLLEIENINEAHDPFFLTGKISQYLCEVSDYDEVKEVLTCVAKGLKNGLDKRKKLLSSETDANNLIEMVFDNMIETIES
jgi:hypothetical protein